MIKSQAAVASAFLLSLEKLVLNRLNKSLKKGGEIRFFEICAYQLLSLLLLRFLVPLLVNVGLEALGPAVGVVALQHVDQVVDVGGCQPQRFDLELRAWGECLHVVWISTLLSLVSQGTLGMQSLSEEKAALIDCVLRLSFLLDPTPNLFRLSARIGPTPSPEKNTDSCEKQTQVIQSPN